MTFMEKGLLEMIVFLLGGGAGAGIMGLTKVSKTVFEVQCKSVGDDIKQIQLDIRDIKNKLWELGVDGSSKRNPTSATESGALPEP